MPEPRDHMQNRNWAETILHKIPGFKGYLEKEYRRDSDALQRKWLAERLQRSKRGLDEYARELVDSAQIDSLPKLERLRSRLDKAIARISGAMQGYSGVFDLVQIREAELDQVYEYDVQMMGKVDEIAEAVENLSTYVVAATASGGPTEVISDLSDKLEEFEKAWDARQDLLKGLK